MGKHRASLIVAIFGAVLALFLAILSLTQHIRIQNEGFENESFCAISETLNCDIVNASSYSEFLGVPVALWGIAFYSFLIFLAFISIFSKENKRSYAIAGWLATSAGILYSMYLAYIAAFVLGVACIECIGMYLGTILAWFGFFPSMEVGLKKTPSFTIKYLLSIVGLRKMNFPLNLGRIIIIAIILFGTAIISYTSLAGSKVSSNNKELLNDLLKVHFSQSGYDIQVDPSWPVWGNPNAKVTIIEFSEFQCPFCKLSALNLRPRLFEFRNKIRYYFVQFPLDSECNPYISRRMHPKACIAAKASICANEQGHFWEYHDDIFRNNKKISRKLLLDLANKNHMNIEIFDDCLANPATLEKIHNDCSLAEKLHVNGTPTIFVNNKIMRFWRNPEFVRAVIKKEIKKTK